MITTLDEYRQAAAALRQAMEQLDETLERNLVQMSDFLRYRAAKNRFFPQHPDDDLTFYKKTKFNIELSAQLEMKVARPVLLSQATVEGDMGFVEQLHQQPFIFCTFHFGSFQLVGALLRHYGFDLSVLTLREGITADMLHAAGGADQLDVLHADSPSVMLDMHNALQKGKSIMAFVDGNPDVISEADRKSYARVNLMGHQVLAKRGIPSLSYATGVPIIPIISYRQGPERVRVAFGAPIWPDRSISKAEYVQQTLQTCYQQLERQLLVRPEQWLYWRVINNYVDLTGVWNKGPAAAGHVTHYTINKERYELYEAPNSRYLYDRYTQNAFSISENLFRYLRYINTTPDPAEAVAQRINAKLLQELLAKQIMVGLTLSAAA